jgi:hypothetical protein
MKTNIEFVKWLMNYSPHGALCQVFIIEAIRHYAEQISHTKPPEPENDNGFISAIAWHNIAVDILNKIENRNK